MMKTRWMVLLMVAAMGVVGCSDSGIETTQGQDTAKTSDSREKVVEDQLDLINEMIGVLEGVTDKESAEEAKPELEELIKEAEATQARMKELGEPSEEEEKELEEKYGEQMEGVAHKVGAQMGRLRARPEAMAVIREVDLSRMKKAIYPE